jgi:hypothetical protein
MKLIISHRGNLYGRNELLENSPEYILAALDEGFDVEIDVWGISDQLFLGHDAPQHPIDHQFLTDPRLWIHCKNVDGMNLLAHDLSLNIISHTDGIVFTKDNFLWTAPGFPIRSRSIAVMPELVKSWDISEAYGVCTDIPFSYRHGHCLSNNNVS